jgi:hypothetical protein
MISPARPGHNKIGKSLVAATVDGHRRRSRDRAQARGALNELVLRLRCIGGASNPHFDESMKLPHNSPPLAIARQTPALLYAAESWSLFVLARHDAHDAASRQLVDTASSARH